MVIICRDVIGCFILALLYLENVMGDIQYKMWFSIRERGGTLCTTLSVFLYTSPCQLCSGVELKLIVTSIRKCKHLALMVNICKDIGCFMLALFYLENLIADFQYTMWFSTRVRGGTLHHPQCFSAYLPFLIFSGFELILCLLSKNVNILLKW